MCLLLNKLGSKLKPIKINEKLKPIKINEKLKPIKMNEKLKPIKIIDFLKRKRKRRGVGVGVGHGRRGYVQNNISDDIRATFVDRVINHGLTMREAVQRVHPHLSRFTVASIIRRFGLENRYVFNSPLHTVFTVLYHITLLYHMYCIASWLVLLL